MDHRGGVSFLSRRPPFVPAGGFYAGAANRCRGAKNSRGGGGCGDPNRQVVAQNLLVILHEVENRLQDEMATVKGFASKLQPLGSLGSVGLYSDGYATVSKAADRRTGRSIWCNSRALPGLVSDHASGRCAADGLGGAGGGAGGASREEATRLSDRTVGSNEGWASSLTGCSVASSEAPPGAGCGDWCTADNLKAVSRKVTHKATQPDSSRALSITTSTRAGKAVPTSARRVEVRPSWMSPAGSAASSYKYFLGRQPLYSMDRPRWLSPTSVPPGHPLSTTHHSLLGPPMREPSIWPCLEPPLTTPLDPPLALKPRSALSWERTGKMAAAEGRVTSRAVSPCCLIGPGLTPVKRTVTCPEYRRAVEGRHQALRPSLEPSPMTALALRREQIKQAAEPLSSTSCELQEVFKNERVMESEAGSGSREGSVPSESGTPPDDCHPGEFELPRCPTSSPACTPPPVGPQASSAETPARCTRPLREPAAPAPRQTEYKEILQCADDPHDPQDVSPLSPEGVGVASGAGGLAWLVDAVHLLKEYYLKRAQLCLESNIAASCHQLVEPERDVCKSDANVGTDPLTTTDTGVTTDTVSRVDVATNSPGDGVNAVRVCTTSSRTTQTPPVVCHPVSKTGDFHWLATDAFQPDLALYVSCFDEADDKKRA